MIKLGLIGTPIEHSLSPSIFSSFFKTEGMDGTYKLFDISSLPSEGVKLFMQRGGLVGLNVTIPYKVEVITHCDVLHSSAKRIGAVNTVVLEGDQLVGYNTDYNGIKKSLECLGNPPSLCAVFGNGGASKAVQKVLSDFNIPYKIVSRKNGDLSFEEIDANFMKRAKWWINATPVGSLGNSQHLLPLPIEVLNEEFAIFDLVYRPVITPLMQEGILANSTVLGGELMLNEQAKTAWKYFRAAYYKNM